MKPVINFKFAATLTVVALNLARFATLYSTAP
jgi:hypothetical protein